MQKCIIVLYVSCDVTPVKDKIIMKLTNTEQAKIAITADLHQQNWDALYAEPESIKKAEILRAEHSYRLRKMKTPSQICKNSSMIKSQSPVR